MNPNSHNNKFYANGGVVGQEIEFDFQGEDKKGVIKEITDMGDYIVITNDGRTLLAEERDIIKLGDMQKIAPEAPSKKRFGLFEAGGDLGGEPKEVKGYRVRIFSSDLGSNSNLLDGKTSAILVTDGKTGDSSTVMSNEPHLRLIKRQLFGKTILSAEPVNYGHQGKHKMFGGTFVWSSDSRFRENISEAPIQLHDRVEFATGGSTESQYKIIEGFDHYKNRPLYQVSDMEDYEGEWHANYFDAQKELDDLNKNKFETGGNIEKENNEMLHSQAVEAKHHIEELDRIINSSTKVEPWVLSKMTRAKTDLSDITHYLEGENKASMRKPVYAEGGDVNQRGDYMLLGRLQADCDFYLGFGNRNERSLWAGNVKDQIAEMRSIYNRLKVKPEWITMKDINRYEKEMTTKMSTGGGVGSANSKIYKLRAEGLNDFLAFLQKGMYMRVKSFTVKPIGVPDVEVSFETDASLSEIKSKLREVPDSHVMIETVKPFNEYTGEREEDYAEGGILGSNFNPKSFTLEELNNHINDKDIYISYFQLGWSGITPASENKMIFTDTSSLGFKQWKNKKLTISDYGQIEVDRGSENIGLTVIVYEETSEKPYTIKLYSKDNHNGLKEVAKELITKMSRGGKLTKAQQAKIGKVMSEFKSGKLHSGSKRGPIVRKRKQALAIALAEAGASRKMSTGGGVNQNIESNIISVQENADLKEFLKHPIFNNFKEIVTFSSGGGYNHTMILLSNDHIVTINWESGDVQYSYFTYKSIEEYLEEPTDEERGWDNEFDRPELKDGIPNYSDLKDLGFLDRMMSTKMSTGGSVSDYTNQTGLKSTLLNDSAFTNLLLPFETSFIAKSETKIFKKGTALYITDGNREIVIGATKPFTKLKKLGDASANVKEAYSNSKAKVNNVFKDQKTGVIYSVEQRPDGVWTIFSEGPQWSRRDEFKYGFRSEADAIDSAKFQAGITTEEDPEAYFFRETELKGWKHKK